MSEEITPELFIHLVELAALELDATESEYLRRQLNLQLESIHVLTSIPVDEGTPIAAHGVPYPLEISPAIRPDVVDSYPEPRTLLDCAPAVDDGYLVVPEVPSQSLDKRCA